MLFENQVYFLLNECKQFLFIQGMIHVKNRHVHTYTGVADRSL